MDQQAFNGTPGGVDGLLHRGIPLLAVLSQQFGRSGNGLPRPRRDGIEVPADCDYSFFTWAAISRSCSRSTGNTVKVSETPGAFHLPPVTTDPSLFRRFISPFRMPKPR